MSDNDPQPIPRKTPKKKGDGPSMREQILARRRAEEQSAGGGTRSAPKKSAPAKKATAKKHPAVQDEIKVSDSSRPGGRTRAGAKRAHASRPRRTRGEGDDEAPRAGGRARRERPVKKKSPVPIIAAVVVVVGGGIGGYFAMTGGETEASETDGNTTGDATTAGTSDETTDGTTADGVTDDTTGAEDAEGATGDEQPGEDPAATEDTPKPKPAPAEEEDVDLSELEPFGKPEGATDEEWTNLQEDAETFFDIDAGAAGSRAQRRLEAAGKNAWPAILNQMIKLDPANPDDNQLGMLGQRALNAARGSDTAMAFDWRTPDNGVLSEKNLRYNRKLIKALYTSWASVVADPSHWERLDKSDAQAEAKAREEAKVDDELEFDPGDLDDLDG